MSDRFPSKKSRPATDRAATTRRATSGRAAPTRTPTRQDSPLIDRMAKMRAGQGAVDFGRQQTSQPGVEAAINAIRQRVMQNLSSKGIYQDDRGSYQIRGMERGDNGLAIRDSAVAAMGGPDWTRIVNEADARLRGGLPGAGMPAGAPVKTATSVGGVEPAVLRKTATSVGGTEPIPQPGLGGVPGIPQRPIPTVGTGAPPITRTPGAGGTVPSPGLGGVPVPQGSDVRPAPPLYPGGPQRPVGGLPMPGTQPPPAPLIQPAPYMGPEAAARQQQQTIFNASPGLGGTVFTPHEQQTNVIPQGGVWNEPSQAALGARTNVPGAGGTLPSPGLGGVYGAQPAVTPNPNSPGPSVQRQGTAPLPPTGGVPRPGPAPSGTPAAPGRPSTPTVAPGSLPGSTTPSRPGQMPTVFPNGQPFGTPGQPVVSQQMGAQIRQDVASRVGGIRAQAGMPGQAPSQGVVAGASLSGLGDRIRASVTRGIAGVNDQIGVGASDLGGGLGSSIAASVRAQLAQQGLGRGIGMPQQPGLGGVPGQMGTTPGYGQTTQGLQGRMAANPYAAPGAAPAPGGAVGPTGSYGPGWPGDQMDTLNATYDQTSQQTGVPGNAIKAIQTLETGGNVIGYTGQVGGPDGDVALNSGIKSGTAAAYGLDFNQIVNDPNYAAHAIGVVMAGIGSSPASSWQGGEGMSGTVLENGGWDAVANIYFAGMWGGGDVTGRPSSQYVADYNNYLNQLGGYNAPVQGGTAPTPGQPTPTGNVPISETQLQSLGVTDQGAYDPAATNQPLPPPTTRGGLTNPNGTLSDQALQSLGITPGGVSPSDTIDQSSGTESGTPLPTTGAERWPIASGTLSPTTTPLDAMTGSAQGTSVPQGDGIGVYAGPGADESWMQLMNPDAYVSTEYKQDVCQTYDSRCCNCGGPCNNGCPYDSNVIPQMSGASNAVHPGYDVGMAPGTEFATPMGGTVIGNNSNPNGPGCVSPAGTNECNWAYDNGVAMSGGTDMNGQPIYINYDHVTGGDYSTQYIGKEIPAGTALGVVGDAAHIHVEIHGYCEKTGKMVVLDPSLVFGGYYQTHSACEGVA